MLLFCLVQTTALLFGAKGLKKKLDLDDLANEPAVAGLLAKLILWVTDQSFPDKNLLAALAEKFYSNPTNEEARTTFDGYCDRNWNKKGSKTFDKMKICAKSLVVDYVQYTKYGHTAQEIAIAMYRDVERLWGE